MIFNFYKYHTRRLMDIPYIVVAGGKGTRMNTKKPKQYIEVNGKPIIYYTISNLVKAGIKRFIIVIDLTYLDYLKKVLNQFEVSIEYVAGGKERIDSVINGLRAIDNKDDIVAIHDSVRPLVSKKMINRLHSKILNSNFDAVVPALAIKDTIKKVTADKVDETLVRSKLKGIGTPQLVRVKEYLKAIANIGSSKRLLTDDASILELNGFSVGIVEGEEESFKITDVYDLKVFKLLLGEE